MTGVSRSVWDGGSGHAAYGDTLTSAAVTLDAAVQQVSIRYKVASSGTGLYFDMLRGPTFSTVVALAGSPLSGTIGQWTTYKKAINTYAGETVKFRITPQLGAVTVDDVDLEEQVVPGWSFTSGSAAALIAKDPNGTYVKSFTSTGAIQINSSPVDLGIVDDSSFSDGRSFVVSYSIGYATGSLIYVDWVPDTGSPVRVYADAANSATGFKNGRFKVWDTVTTSGHFWVNLTGGGRLYSLGDNIARQQLAEPFSQQVRVAGGSSVDTTTGSFGVSSTDLSIQGDDGPCTQSMHSAADFEFTAKATAAWKSVRRAGVTAVDWAQSAQGECWYDPGSTHPGAIGPCDQEPGCETALNSLNFGSIEGTIFAEHGQNSPLNRSVEVRNGGRPSKEVDSGNELHLNRSRSEHRRNDRLSSNQGFPNADWDAA